MQGKGPHKQADNPLSMAWALLMAFGLACLISMGCHQQRYQPQPDENYLIRRINQYYNTLQCCSYKDAHLFYAHRPSQTPMKKPSLTSALSLTIAAYKIQSIHLEQMKAQVVMHITLAEQENQYDIMLVDNWQFIEDTWFVINTVHPAAEGSIRSLDGGVWQGGIKW